MAATFRFASFCAWVINLLRGKSTSTRMRLELAKLINCGVSKTSVFSFVHSPSESETVKFNNMNLFSRFACNRAAGTSVTHCTDWPKTGLVHPKIKRKINLRTSRNQQAVRQDALIKLRWKLRVEGQMRG